MLLRLTCLACLFIPSLGVRDLYSTCLTTVGSLAQFLAQESEVAAQILVLETVACPLMPDQELCEQEVETWWGDVLGAMLSKPDAAGNVCNAVNATLPSEKEQSETIINIKITY